MKNKLGFFGVLFMIYVIINPYIHNPTFAANTEAAGSHPQLSSTATPKPTPEAPLICIDPGHQLKANNGLEPIGPKSTIQKPKVSSGTTGVSTKKAEFQLNLEVALLLRDKLLEKGYRVVMTRETNKVDLRTKIERCWLMQPRRPFFVRIHADGNEKSSVNGISIQYPAEANSYKNNISKTSKSAATEVLKALIKETGAHSRSIVPRNDLSGFNWSKVPSILVEMGFMTNAKEECLCPSQTIKKSLAKGMVNEIEKVAFWQIT